MQVKQLKLSRAFAAAKILNKQLVEALRTDFDYIVVESDGKGLFLATLMLAKMPGIKGVKTVTEVISNRRNLSKRRLLFVTEILTVESFSKIQFGEFSKSCVVALFANGSIRMEWRLDTRVFIGGNFDSQFKTEDFSKLWRSKLCTI